MAPRKTLTEELPGKRTIVKKNITVKGRPTTPLRKNITIKNTTEMTPIKKNSPMKEKSRQRTVSVPNALNKDNKPVVNKKAMTPAWKRKPKPAHSGVPLPDKMKKMLLKQIQDLDTSV